MGEMQVNVWVPVCLHFCDQKQPSEIKSQIDAWYLEDGTIFAHPGFCKLCTSAQVCLPHSWGWGRGNSYCDKSWNWPNSAQFTLQVFPWKLQVVNRLQSYKIVTTDRFCQCNCCPGRESDIWCLLPWSS